VLVGEEGKVWGDLDSVDTVDFGCRASCRSTNGQCTTAIDCALNGQCVNGVCQCRAMWSRVPNCSVVAFEPAIELGEAYLVSPRSCNSNTAVTSECLAGSMPLPGMHSH
jgi:hypothetical protein